MRPTYWEIIHFHGVPIFLENLWISIQQNSINYKLILNRSNKTQIYNPTKYISSPKNHKNWTPQKYIILQYAFTGGIWKTFPVVNVAWLDIVDPLSKVNGDSDFFSTPIKIISLKSYLVLFSSGIAEKPKVLRKTNYLHKDLSQQGNSKPRLYHP